MHHLVVAKQALIHLFDTIIIVLIVYYQMDLYECENLNHVIDGTSRDVDMDQVIDCSIITIFDRLWSTFIKYIVFGYTDYKSYYLSLIYSTVVSLSIAITQLIFCNINQWIKQYCNYLNEKFDAIQSENDTTYQLNGNMHCVSIYCILMCIMIIICVVYFVYLLQNYLVCQEMTLSYHFIQIINLNNIT